MAKLKNQNILMKRLLAVLCMSTLTAVSLWSQKPKTGFSDLKRHGARTTGTVVAPRQSEQPVKAADTDIRVDEDNEAWQYTSFVNLGYVYDQTLKYSGTVVGYNGKWGAALQVGNSYMWPADAFFDMVKIAVDATWFDLSGTQYEDPDNDHWQIAAGMGVGASLHIAPFVNISESLSPLRVECYGRFVPSYSVLLKKSNIETDYVFDLDEAPQAVAGNKMKAHGAFLPVVSFGFGLNYKAIGLGYEHRFGTATYKGLTDDGADVRYDMTSDRIYISLRM